MDFTQVGINIIELLSKYWRVFLVEGLVTTLEFTCIAVILGVILGTFVAMLKMSKFRIIRFLVSIYIEVIRGTPILLQLYVFYFVLPTLFPFLNLSQFMWVAIAMCVNSGAYVSEVIRSGIQAVDKGQTEAARSLGMNQRQTMIKIIIPQATKNVLPALCNEFVTVIKETSIACTFFVGELMTTYKTMTAALYLTIEPLIIVAAIYFFLNFTLSKAIAAFERRLQSGD